jgi:hypothetical protein
MKIVKYLLYVVGILLTLYLLTFALWLLLTLGCFNYVDQNGLADAECRDNVLTQVVLKTHAPLLATIFPGKE